MITHPIITAFVVLAAGAICFSTFCRLTRMSQAKVKRKARMAFWTLSAVAWVTVFAAVVYGWKPDLGHAAMLGVTAWLQWLRRSDWETSVPKIYLHSRMEDLEAFENMGEK